MLSENRHVENRAECEVTVLHGHTAMSGRFALLAVGPFLVTYYAALTP